ncbi:hypothetical protein BUALT_Bualt03G0213100 [Buddleja alternifolia]|uniref:ENTH domain-containing protein n=1 Tax=Buddleja alternifolia TaxID=168488 RepID=A0AAV6XX17_9LAMI|nr:hypothetical protein BUALT_Bualt03G0213100 [Buddleja alternifolia]
MTSKLKKAIGAVKDQTSISLAKVSNNNSSNLEVVVLKSTTHDDIPIDGKYVQEVLRLVSSNKAHAAACARAIGKRIGRTRNWVVALKSLMLVLRIFQDGDPYFPREVLHAMKRGAKILNLTGFRDDSNSNPWDFTAFVRTFALYLDERLECFLTGQLQRRYKHEGSGSGYQRSKSRSARKPNEPVRDMKPAMLLDKMSYWQRLLERAIATRPTGAAKANRLVQICLYAIVQETFELYKDISDGLALVLDSFFHLQYQNCVSAFQTCVKAVKLFEELSAFYTLCKSIGVGRTSEYPSVQAISEELIETLQEFLKDQSSFTSNAKPGNRLLLLPAPQSNDGSKSGRHDSTGGQSELSVPADGHSERNSEFGSQSTSLEDLISATETWTGPSISIDLEAYSPSKQEEPFRISDAGSTRSLPVSNSMADLMSLADWSEQGEKEERNHQQETQNGLLDSSASKNWELMLAETISASPQPLSDINTNTFNAFPEQPPTNNPSTTANNGWDLVLFEAPAAAESHVLEQSIPNVEIPLNDHHYNPFLQDEIRLPEASIEPVIAPTFSAQNPNVSENDRFACADEFSGEQMLSSSTDQQNLMQEQHLWLQNQNKIIAKRLG